MKTVTLIDYSYLNIERIECTIIGKHYVGLFDSGEIRNVNQYKKINEIQKYGGDMWHGLFTDDKKGWSLIRKCLENNTKVQGEVLVKYQRLLEALSN